MCVGITPPCSRCGAPARWKSMQQTCQEALKRLHRVAIFIEELEDDCPIKEELKSIVNGGNGE